MSFGFGVIDFLTVLKTAKGVYEACKDGPADYQELCRETESLRCAIGKLSQDAEDPRSLLNRRGSNRMTELFEIVQNCKMTIKDVQAFIDKHSSLKSDARGELIRIWDAYQVGSSDLDSFRSKLNFNVSMISMFLLSLQAPVVANIETKAVRIEKKLNRIYAQVVHGEGRRRQSSVSLASSTSIISQIDTHEDDAWEFLKTRLLAEGILMDDIKANRDKIISHIKSLVNDDLPQGKLREDIREPNSQNLGDLLPSVVPLSGYSETNYDQIISSPPLAYSPPRVMKVSRLLRKLSIQTRSAAEETVRTLPPTLVKVIAKVGENELQLKFPLTTLTILQRLAIRPAMGEDVVQNVVVHINLAKKDLVSGFYVRPASSFKDYSPWLMMTGEETPEGSFYIYTTVRYAFQLSLILWRHLREDFVSVASSYSLLASNLTHLARACMICGRGRTPLLRSTVCQDSGCVKTFRKATHMVHLVGAWQSPTVVDLLLSMIHSTVWCSELDLLTDCPIDSGHAVLELLHEVPRIADLRQHIEESIRGSNAPCTLSKCLTRFTSRPDSMADLLVWACNSYRGFLIPATDEYLIQGFPNHQFLLANTTPELEKAFNLHVRRGETSDVLFHGTTFDRLHAIICQGLLVCSGTPLQRVGAYHGDGIYTADEPAYAWSFARKANVTTRRRFPPATVPFAPPAGMDGEAWRLDPPAEPPGEFFSKEKARSSRWKGSATRGLRVLLGCELVGEKPGWEGTHIITDPARGTHIITDPTRLILRYVFFMRPDEDMPLAKDVRPAMQRAFASLRREKIGGEV
ncbi:hypothetical protein OEA41_004997 [Lepraria neglecta]|uniref:PARP catalytic domain-containing protein n=1 Tax=Lepraria neglecta TaxID=209136 RepID=A0AAE0DGD1_9LECA|nr:hypothetical protein OEA41_004997 [Lepraria neglecta]